MIESADNHGFGELGCNSTFVVVVPLNSDTGFRDFLAMGNSRDTKATRCVFIERRHAISYIWTSLSLSLSATQIFRLLSYSAHLLYLGKGIFCSLPFSAHISQFFRSGSVCYESNDIL